MSEESIILAKIDEVDSEENNTPALLTESDSNGNVITELLGEADSGENIITTILDKVLALPGVKINRTTFLMDTYHLSEVAVKSDDISEFVTLDQMDSAAKKFITANVTQSSAAAFALGLPGGIAMAATIPADIMQNFAFSLHLAQQLAYIYGFDDLFTENNEMDEKTRHTFIAFLGVMFAAAGSGTVLRAIAPNVGKYVAKQTLKKPLTKTVWYPMLKKIANIITSKTITKNSVSQFAAKAIPVVGGVVSAGISVATMLPMANRLKNELRKYYLSEEEIREIEEKEQITFSDKASDVFSDVAAGSVKAVEKAKNVGKGFSSFAKQISDKTKGKLDKEKTID